MGELEKLGSKYRVALRYSRYLLYNISFTSFSLFLKTCIMVIYFISRIARDPRFKRLPCLHKGTYADDCIVKRITQVSLGSQQKITLLHAAHFTSLISDILISLFVHLSVWFHRSAPNWDLSRLVLITVGNLYSFP